MRSWNRPPICGGYGWGIFQEKPAPWSLARHIAAARHFGEFNGAFTHRYPLRDYGWLTHHFLRQWLACCRAWGSDATLSDPSVWAAPRVQGVLPSDLASAPSSPTSGARIRLTLSPQKAA